MIEAIFPVWYRILAGLLIAATLIFDVHITVTSWDVLTGADISEFAVWRMMIWTIFIVGSGINLLAVLIFTHYFGVMQPLIRKSLSECRPPAPPSP